MVLELQLDCNKIILIDHTYIKYGMITEIRINYIYVSSSFVNSMEYLCMFETDTHFKDLLFLL